MRDDLDEILALVGAEPLTDGEFGTVPEGSLTDQEQYDALASVLADRESISDTKDRLKFYFLARGVSIEEFLVGKSNIMVGSQL